MAWLSVRTHDGALPITRSELGDFQFGGKPFRLMDLTKGIWKPRVLESALSFTTTYRAPGKPRPYEDDPGPDGRLRYKWEGTDPNLYTNVGLRNAMKRRQPLIWFFGLGESTYQPVYPVYLVAEEPEQQQFVVSHEESADLPVGSPLEEHLRRYALRVTRQRLHQPVFRAQVLRAYGSRCTVCSLGHPELLDGAHIVADAHEEGIAAIRNGLSMCKIHHAAYDSGIMGIRPDRVVEIRNDLLDEVDGPMLRHGLQERHRQPLMVVPSKRTEQPDSRLLAMRYEQFRSA